MVAPPLPRAERSAPLSVSARELSAAALRAAEVGTLDRWSTPWNERLRIAPTDRSALFAVATSERLRYRLLRADSLYARVASSAPDDVLARQATLWRATLRAVRGQAAEASTQLLQLEQRSLRDTDTSTALDAILVRSATVMRVDGASAAALVLARGDSLRWSREPMLDAASRCRWASVRSRLGDRLSARKLAREGEAIALRAGLSRLAATCVFTLATEFARSGLTDSLRAPMLRAIAMQERTGDLAGLASTSQWAGFYVSSLGHFTPAQRYLATAWSASMRAGVVDVAAWTALNRAAIAQRFFDAAATTLWLARADSLMRIVNDPQGRIEVSRTMARQSALLGDYDGARAQLIQALEVAERLGEPTGRVSIIATLQDTDLRAGRLDDAARWLRENEVLIERYKMSGLLSSQHDREAELALHRGDARTALQLLDHADDALHPSQYLYRHGLELRRSLALAMTGDVAAAARSALSAGDTFDRWRASLSDSSLRLLTVQAQRGSGWYVSELTARLADAGEVEVAFTLAERRRARDLRERLLMAGGTRLAPDATPLGIDALRRAIPDASTAIVTIDAGEDDARGTAFILTQQSMTAFPMPSVREIAPRIRRLVAWHESGRDASVDARMLGTALIGPLLSQLDSERITRLVILPEGVLHRLPFDVLRLPDGRYLLERFETAVAPSANVLARLRALPSVIGSSTAAGSTGRARALALADARVPVRVGTDTTLGGRLLAAMLGRDRRLPRLVGARDEVAWIERAMPGTVGLRGAAAREDVFKRDAGGFPLLHLATHAVVDEWSGATAAIALTPGGDDDGTLDSGEISTLSLNANVVVLSACRTVGGEIIAGEGVRGLTSAFLQAGARSVVATSWRVNDRAVVPLVGAMYESLALGQPIGRALRDAKLASLARGDGPSVWGAFTLVGDPMRTVSAASRATAPVVAPPASGARFRPRGAP